MIIDEQNIKFDKDFYNILKYYISHNYGTTVFDFIKDFKNYINPKDLIFLNYFKKYYNNKINSSFDKLISMYPEHKDFFIKHQQYSGQYNTYEDFLSHKRNKAANNFNI